MSIASYGDEFIKGRIAVAEIIYTRNRKQYEAATEELRRKDLAATKKKYRAQQVAARKAAAINEKHLLDAKTARPNSGTPKKRPVTQGQHHQRVNAKAAWAKRKSQARVKNRKKKKKRSVWTVSGGAFESNRRRH